MALLSVYAHVSCSDLERSLRWYTQLLERAPDARPMAGLAEWRHGASAGFQLFQDTRHAGASTLTLIVNPLREYHARLGRAGLSPGPIEPGDHASILRLRDPDGNLVVLAQPNL